MPPPERPQPRPKPPKPKPKPKPKTGPELKPTAARPRPQPEREVIPGRVPIMPSSSKSCADYRLCPQPAAPAATVQLRSGRLPTPLIALSASLLTVSAVLLLALLVHRLVRRRRQRRMLGQAAPLAGQQDEEAGHHHQVLAAVAEEGDGEEADDGGGVHHVWYIKTVGLDERAIAAIAAVVYDGKKRGALDGGCAVCLAEFRDGETMRLLPRCRHAFHRGCIDTWLRAHVNCPLCRAPVQPASAAGNAKPRAAAPGTATAATPRARGEAEAGLGAVGGVRAEDAAERGGLADGAVRRSASMVALPRRAWPDVSLRLPAASSSGREEGMTGLGKIRRLLKFSDALEMAGVAGVGRSVSFGVERCQRLPARSGPSAVAGVNGGDMESSR